MAVEQKYTVQFAFVGTATQKAHMTREAARRRSSMAEVLRRAIDERFVLVDGEEPAVDHEEPQVKG